MLFSGSCRMFMTDGTSWRDEVPISFAYIRVEYVD